MVSWLAYSRRTRIRTGQAYYKSEFRGTSVTNSVSDKSRVVECSSKEDNNNHVTSKWSEYLANMVVFVLCSNRP